MAELLPQLDTMRSKLRLVNTADHREVALRREDQREEQEEMFRYPVEETWEVSCDDERPTGQLEPTRSTNRRRAS
jgi:hypothetical protein